MPEKPTDITFFSIKVLSSTVAGLLVLSGAFYSVAALFFTTNDVFLPTQKIVNENAKHISTLTKAIENTVKLSDFKEYIYHKDISDATEKLRQYDKIKSSRDLTLYEESQVTYLVDSITRWHTALEELNQ